MYWGESITELWGWMVWNNCSMFTCALDSNTQQKRQLCESIVSYNIDIAQCVQSNKQYIINSLINQYKRGAYLTNFVFIRWVVARLSSLSPPHSHNEYDVHAVIIHFDNRYCRLLYCFAVLSAYYSRLPSPLIRLASQWTHQWSDSAQVPFKTN